MNRFWTVVGIVLVVGLTLAAGTIHGRMSNRWGPPSAMLGAARKLEEFPPQFGKWQLESTEEMSRTTIKMLECAGYLSRIYKNQDTGQYVTVAVILGPPGPISVHTPEVCFSSRDHKVLEPRRPVTIGNHEDPNDQFWALTFRSDDLHATLLRVYYAWSTGSHWSAADDPRFPYAGSPYLYKIQLATHVPAGTDLEENDPCRTFLSDFVPALREYLIECAGKD